MALSALLLSACNTDSVEYVTDVSPGVAHPDTAGFRVVTRTELDPPTSAYNFTLVDQNNIEVSLGDFRGQVLMITFIYTHCPEACPLVAANFKSVQTQLIEYIEADELTQILITTDPARDTPERLLRYTKAMAADWYFLTGELNTLKQVWDGFDVYWEIKERSKEVVVFHSYKTYLIDRQGRIRYKFVGVWFPDDIIPDVELLLAE